MESALYVKKKVLYISICWTYLFDFVKIIIAINTGIYYKNVHETHQAERTITKGEIRMPPLRRRSPASAGALCPL